MNPEASARSVLVGRIVGLYGVQGWLKIESWTEPRTRIFDYQPWLLTSAPPGDANRPGAALLEVSNVKGRTQGKGLVCNLPDVVDRERAAAFMGKDIYVARKLLPAPENDEYYWVDLEGLAVTTTEGVALGRVTHLFATGANDVMVVRDDQRERLVPFVQGSYVRSVDLISGAIVVDWDPEF